MDEIGQEPLLTYHKIHGEENITLPGKRKIDKSKKISLTQSFKVIGISSTKLSTFIIFSIFLLAVVELYFGNEIGKSIAALKENLTKFDYRAFKSSFIKIIIQDSSICLIIAFRTWVADRLTIILRAQLNNQIHNYYLSKNQFYDILLYNTEVDNPDARITQDCNNWSSLFSQILISIIQMPTLVIFYSFLTIKYFNILALLLCFCFAILSMVISRIVLTPLVKITYSYEAAQGDFRLAHVDIKESAETVSLSHGEEKEKQLLSGRLANVLQLQTYLANYSVPLNIVLNTFQYFGNSIVYICIYLWGPDTNDPSQVSSFVSLFSFAVINLISGLMQIVTISQNISSWWGYSNRIIDLWKAINPSYGKSQNEAVQKTNENNHKDLESFIDDCEKIHSDLSSFDQITFNDITLSTPDGSVLISHLSFSIHRGDSLFITGPSGCGKSSLFRAIARLWPCYQGEIITPPNGILLLTQIPYIPHISFEDCLTFPVKSCEVDPVVLEDAISFLQIENLKERDSPNWWCEISPGEAQRIALARALIHKPHFLLLDEATSAIPEKLEKIVIERFFQSQISLITIAHNQSLKSMYKFVLEFRGGGIYSFTENVREI